MCGRFTLTSQVSEIAKRFKAQAVYSSEASPRYNIAPSQEVIIINNEGVTQLLPSRWGFLPSWVKDISIGNKMTNARSETITEKPAFRHAFKNTRCLIVANGFYEWENKDGRKYPVYITLQSDEPFGFAGLYNVWHSPDGDILPTCTIITTDANELIKPIHDRMPVIMARDKEGIWLDPSVQDKETLLHLLKPYPAQEMDLYSVSPKINSPVYNHPDAIMRIP